MLSGRPGASTGHALFDHALSGGAQALAQTKAGLSPGGPRRHRHPRHVTPVPGGRSGDTILDGWLFAAGSDAIDFVWAGGDKVVAGGRHRLRDKARERFNASVRRLVA